MSPRVTFVCTGNICRSPIGEVVLREALADAGLDVAVDSAGTEDWHVGERADPRALAALRRVGLDGSRHRARQVEVHDLRDADLVLALDAGHARALRVLVPDVPVRLLRSFDPSCARWPEHELDVADPYYGSGDDFDLVVEQVRAATPGLVAHLGRDRARSRAPDGGAGATPAG